MYRKAKLSVPTTLPLPSPVGATTTYLNVPQAIPSYSTARRPLTPASPMVTHRTSSPAAPPSVQPYIFNSAQYAQSNVSRQPVATSSVQTSVATQSTARSAYQRAATPTQHYQPKSTISYISSNSNIVNAPVQMSLPAEPVYIAQSCTGTDNADARTPPNATAISDQECHTENQHNNDMQSTNMPIDANLVMDTAAGHTAAETDLTVNDAYRSPTVVRLDTTQRDQHDTSAPRQPDEMSNIIVPADHAAAAPVTQDVRVVVDQPVDLMSNDTHVQMTDNMQIAKSLPSANISTADDTNQSGAIDTADALIELEAGTAQDTADCAMVESVAAQDADRAGTELSDAVSTARQQLDTMHAPQTVIAELAEQTSNTVSANAVPSHSTAADVTPCDNIDSDVSIVATTIEKAPDGNELQTGSVATVGTAESAAQPAPTSVQPAKKVLKSCLKVPTSKPVALVKQLTFREAIELKRAQDERSIAELLPNSTASALLNNKLQSTAFTGQHVAPSTHSAEQAVVQDNTAMAHFNTVIQSEVQHINDSNNSAAVELNASPRISTDATAAVDDVADVVDQSSTSDVLMKQLLTQGVTINQVMECM